MNKLKSGHPESNKMSTVADQKPKVSESESPILKSSLPHHHSTVKSLEQPVSTFDEQLSVLSSLPLSTTRPTFSHQSSFRESKTDTKW